MKMIHCADLHLDSELNTNLTAEQAGLRRRELLDNFCRMVNYAAEQGVKVVLIAGDLFDREKIAREAVEVVYRTIVQNPQIAFFYLTGNHERAGFVNVLPEIPKNLKLFRDTWTSFRFHGGEIAIHGMNPGAGYKTDLYEKLNCNPDSINIVLLHGQLAGARANQASPELICLRDLAHKNIDYLALGHVHSYREGEIDARGSYVYPGCMEGRGFDEVGEHGFVLLDIDAERHFVDWTLVPWQTRKVCEVAVDISAVYNTSELLNAIDDVLNAKEEAAVLSADDLVHVELVGERKLPAPDLDWLKKQYEQSFYSFKITDSSVQRAKEPEAEEHSLKAEFVRMVRSDDTLSEETRRAVLQYGLAVLRGEEVQP